MDGINKKDDDVVKWCKEANLQKLNHSSLVLCDTYDTSISIVSIDVSIPVSKKSRYIAIYRGVMIPPNIVT